MAIFNNREIMFSTEMNVSSEIPLNQFGDFIERKSEVVLPNTLTKVGDYAFYNYDNLVLNSLPDSIVEIGKGAFQNSSISVENLPRIMTTRNGITKRTNLEELIFNSDTINIGTLAFSGCIKIEDVNVKNAIIGLAIFEGCTNLKKVKISTGYMEIRAFNNCTSVKEYDFTGCNAVPPLANYANSVTGSPEGFRIIVPDNLFDKWKTFSNWGAFFALYPNVTLVKESER